MFLGGAFWLASCGGGGSSSTSPSAAPQTGAVGLFLTDDASTYKQMVTVINSVTLVNSARGSSCSVLASPISMNLPSLANVLQLVNTSSCPAGSYDPV